jgi:hypothetical protein
MNLPSQSQVNAAARNAASFVGGAIVVFGLGTKISPDTLTAIINATGTAINDIITLIGLISPLVAGYYAAHSASQKAQIAAVKDMPGVEKILVNEKASPVLAQIAIDPKEPKVTATPQAADRVAETVHIAAMNG